MLKKGNHPATALKLGETEIRAVRQGSTQLYPGVIRVDNGAEYGEWSYSGSTRSRTLTPWTQKIFQNGTLGEKVYGTPASESQNAASSAYGDWTYNWTTSGNSTRSRALTYTWPDGTTTAGAPQTETGGTRYLVPTGVSGSIGAGGGAVTFDTQSHDYWPDTSGICLQAVPVSDVTATATGGFSVSVSGTTVTVTRGKNMTTSPVGGTVDFSKPGFVSASGTGNVVNVSQAANSYTETTYWDGSTYWNPVCSGYDYVDYRQVRPQYNWATGDVTYGDWTTGEARNHGRVEGQCGWVRGWTGWARTGATCNSAGATGGYNCSGTTTVRYYQEVRYLQFPDGSGRAGTEYRANGVASQRQEAGLCGYSPVSYELTNTYGRIYLQGGGRPVPGQDTVLPGQQLQDFTSVKRTENGVTTVIDSSFRNVQLSGVDKWFQIYPSEGWAAKSLKVMLKDGQAYNFATQYEYNYTTVSADVWADSRKIGTFTVLIEKTYGDCPLPYPPPDEM